jgi:hypothetical protein
MLKMLRKKGPTLFVMPSEARNDKINYFLCSLFSLRGFSRTSKNKPTD